MQGEEMRLVEREHQGTTAKDSRPILCCYFVWAHPAAFLIAADPFRWYLWNENTHSLVN